MLEEAPLSRAAIGQSARRLDLRFAAVLPSFP
jgi:hypothetical protein